MIKNEFKKIGRGARVLEILMIGTCLAFLGLIVFLGGATVVMCFTKTGDRIMAAAAMVSTIAVALCWSHAVRFLPAIGGAWKRLMAALGCIALGWMAGPFYIGVILPRLVADNDDSLPAGALWAVFIIAVFSCLGVGLGMSKEGREVLGADRSIKETRAMAKS